MDTPVRQRHPVTAFVALGANLGNAQATLHQALNVLDRTAGIAVVRASRLYRTAPVDASGPDYFNAVAEIRTELDAPGLLVALQSIEQGAGRVRPYPNAPRTLDLDLLLFGDARIDSPALTVPHPRMWARAFVLVPLAELAPALVTPDALRSVAGQRIEAVAS